jgi:hypothetical protein
VGPGRRVGCGGGWVVLYVVTKDEPNGFLWVRRRWGTTTKEWMARHGRRTRDMPILGYISCCNGSQTGPSSWMCREPTHKAVPYFIGWKVWCDGVVDDISITNWYIWTWSIGGCRTQHPFELRTVSVESRIDRVTGIFTSRTTPRWHCTAVLHYDQEYYSTLYRTTEPYYTDGCARFTAITTTRYLIPVA